MGGGYTRSKSKSEGLNLNLPGSYLEPGAREDIYKQLGYEGYSGGPFALFGRKKYRATGRDPLTEMFAKATGEQEDVLGFARQLMEGTLAPRDATFENSMGRLAASGLATSAPGIWETVGQDYKRRTEGAQLMQQAAQGLAVLQAMPIELRSRLLQILLGQQLGYGSSSSVSRYRSGSGGMSGGDKTTTTTE